MAKKHLTLAYLFLFIILALSACRGHPIPGEMNSPLELSWNRFREIESEDLRLAFIELDSDDRCPADSECIDAGEAKILVRILKNGARLEDLVITVAPNDPTPTYEVGGYLLQVLELQPAEPTDKKASYTLIIEVSRNN